VMYSSNKIGWVKREKEETSSILCSTCLHLKDFTLEEIPKCIDASILGALSFICMY
jgi:hypothetical protein